MPRTLWFRDTAGTLALVGCRRMGSQIRWAGGGGLGAGRISIDYAVAGGRPGLDYQQVAAVRTRPPLLTAWTGLRNLTVGSTTDDLGRVQGVTAAVGSAGPVEVGGPFGLRVETWFTSSQSGLPVGEEHRVEMCQWAEVVTSATEVADLSRHLDEHAKVRHLVAVAAWEPVGVTDLWVQRPDDRMRLRAGAEIDQWRRANTYVLQQSGARAGKPSFLFHLADIGADGLRMWVDLWDHFGRGLRPLVSLADRSMFIETQVLQAGAGLEAIGFQLALDAGVGANGADGESHCKRLERVTADLPAGAIPDLDGWPKASSDTYNAVKHAGREMPGVEDLVLQSRRDQLIFRTWVAARLGMDHTDLARRVADDGLAAEVGFE